ncbi:hypothetical protein [Niveispirillum fermenti]|uniref:hypothetical protein n=1 Tax=Niveispirillum fermenti TaxID=1233113 RepID=UPI003A87B9DC
MAQTSPSQFTPQVLKGQLQNVGLSCQQLTDANLAGYVANVDSQLPNGSVQSFGILAKSSDLTASSGMALKALAGSNNSALVQAATANWEPGTQAEGFNNYLEVIAYPDHFKWLLSGVPQNQFTGVYQAPQATSGNYPNAQAIQDLFVNVCTTASATLINGLDQTTMKAILTNVIQPLNDAQLSDYNNTASRTIMLVENYNTSTGYADAIGVLYVGWTLTISDYKRKSKDGGDTHPTTLTVESWSVTYEDGSILCRDYNAVCTQFGLTPMTCPPN